MLVFPTVPPTDSRERASNADAYHARERERGELRLTVPGVRGAVRLV